VEKAQVAGPQKRPLARVRQVRPKCLHCIYGSAPVPLGNAGARQPDLPHPVARAARVRFGVDHDDLLVRPGPPAAHQRPGILAPGGRCDHPMALELRSFHGERDGRSRFRTTGNEQGGFREPVGRVERLPAKAAGREGRREPLKGLLPDGLGTVESHRPAAEVEVRQLFGGDLAGTEVVGEVRRARAVGPQSGDGPQPTEGTLQKGNRRHKRSRKPTVEGLQYPHDQPHVMVGG
jgi:hypothetical protein